jgi:hypothetical protein
LKASELPWKRPPKGRCQLIYRLVVCHSISGGLSASASPIYPASMRKRLTVIQWLAWFYAANFLFIVALSHWPGLTDANGKLMGLFAIDPIDDIFHLLSGLLAAIVALHSHRWSVNYFKYAGIPYAIDAITGLGFSREFLNGDIFRLGLGSADFSTHNILNNLPHILIPATQMWIGFWLSRRVRQTVSVKSA